MKAYKYSKAIPSLISINNKLPEGESIERRVARMLNNKEPLSDSSPLQYTERKDGVQPQYNVRTDRFEIAVDAMDSVHRADVAKADDVLKVVKDDNNGDDDGEAKSAEGTNDN